MVLLEDPMKEFVDQGEKVTDVCVRLPPLDPDTVNVVGNVLLFALLLTVSVVARVFDACENKARMTE